jgi:hypothetical protein
MNSRSVACHAAVLLLLVVFYVSGEESGHGGKNEGRRPTSLTGAAEAVSEIQVRKGFGCVYIGSQESGENQLDQLARRATREDAWLFLDGLWIDVGYDERDRSVLCSWEAVRSLTNNLVDAELVWYHIHPIASDSTGVHPPSIEDIFALVRLRGFCEEDWGVRLVGRVFDGRGIWEVDLHGGLWRKLRTQQVPHKPSHLERSDPRDTASLLSSPTRKRELAWLALYLDHEQIAREILQNHNGERDEVIRRYIAAMADIGVLIDYTDLGGGLLDTD